MRQQRTILAICCVAQLLVVLDSSILTVALPQLATDLVISSENLPWVVNAFAIPIAGLLLVSGRLADTFGARRILLCGVALFAVASLIGGTAPTVGVLVAARVAQGVAAALISPATLSLLSHSFPAGAGRARAFGLWGAAAGSGGAIGVLAGGLLVEWSSWRWTLLINVPLCFVLLCLLGIAIRRISPVHMGSPDLPLRRLAGKRVWQLPLAMLLIGAAMTSTFYFLTLNFQVHRDLTALETGLSFLPLSVAAFIAAAASPVLVKRLGSMNAAVLSVFLMGVCLLAIASAAQAGWTGAIILASVGFGAGMGVAISTLANLVTASFPSELAGIASGILTTAQQIGNTIGLAAVVTIDIGSESPSHNIAFLAAAVLAVIAAGWLASQSPATRFGRFFSTSPLPAPAQKDH